VVSQTRKYIVYVLAIVAAIYSLAPIYNLISISFMDPKQLIGGQLFPPTPNFDNYLRLFGFTQTTSSGGAFAESEGLRQGLTNSIIIATAVMVITIAACLPAGYALGRMKLRGRTPMIALLLGSRTLPPVSVALPYYFLFSAIGLRGTLFGIILVQLSITIPIVAWVLMGFMGALPRDMEYQARIDGCSRFQAFRRALLPLAAPGIAASAVIAFLFSWNDFFFSWLLTSGTPAQTYNTFLTAFFGQASGSEPQPTIFAAAVVIQILVAIVVAGFLQKYISSLKIVDPGTIVA
jgi:ABC-type glycerol-3-phosphate transport system permease component